VTCSGYRLFIYDLLAGDIVPGDIYDLYVPADGLLTRTSQPQSCCSQTT
jgi:hypothetical protein